MGPGAPTRNSEDPLNFKGLVGEAKMVADGDEKRSFLRQNFFKGRIS